MSIMKQGIQIAVNTDELENLVRRSIPEEYLQLVRLDNDEEVVDNDTWSFIATFTEEEILEREAYRVEIQVCYQMEGLPFIRTYISDKDVKLSNLLESKTEYIMKHIDQTVARAEEKMNEALTTETTDTDSETDVDTDNETQDETNEE